jgi:hypothetical protein
LPLRTAFWGLLRRPLGYALEDKFAARFENPLSTFDVYDFIYFYVNGNIYMIFRDAVDAICDSLSHEDVAKALGVSVQTVRQARLSEDSKAFRTPPKNWKAAIIRLAEARVLHYRKLIDKLKTKD